MEIEEIIVNPQSEEEYWKFMEFCESKGWEVRRGILPTQFDCWTDYGKDTCLKISQPLEHNPIELSCADKDYFSSKNKVIVPLEDFYKQMRS